MRKSILVFSLLLAIASKVSANMASPYINGTNMSEAYSSKDIDILSEEIEIRFIDAYNAKFTIIYNIRSDRRGKQIPLIFDTMTDRYADEGEFKVWLDGQEIPVSNIPSTYENPTILSWIDSLDHHLSYPKDDAPNIIGLKYFETDLSGGKHTIRVEYTAVAEVYVGRPVREYRFRYNLEPARYWRSFNDLAITIDVSALVGRFSTDLADEGEFSGIKHWHFLNLPQNTLVIKYNPKINLFASALVSVTPGGISIFLILILIALHISWILRYRRKYPNNRCSLAVIAGSILIPFIYCILFVFSFHIQDWVIGDHASGRHGYTFLVFFAYPVFLIFYMSAAWLIDFIIKRKIRSKISKNG